MAGRGAEEALKAAWVRACPAPGSTVPRPKIAASGAPLGACVTVLARNKVRPARRPCRQASQASTAAVRILFMVRLTALRSLGMREEGKRNDDAPGSLNTGRQSFGFLPLSCGERVASEASRVRAYGLT